MSTLRMSLYQPREGSAFHPSRGNVELDAASIKVMGLRVRDEDVSLWREAIKAITVALDLREVMMRKAEQRQELAAIKAALADDPDNPFLLAHLSALEGVGEGGAGEV